MASISDFGIGFAPRMAVLAVLSLSAAAAAQPPLTSDIQIEIDGLRDANGQVLLCLVDDPKYFPDCKGVSALHAAVKASTGSMHHTFMSVPTGTYAVAAFHDANGNGKLDTIMGIPKEGFAFSRNPKMHARAPYFGEASFENNRMSLAPLKMKYIL